MKYLFLLILTVAMLLVSLQTTSAQQPCTVLFGGGLKSDGSFYCLEAATNQSFPTPTQATQTPLGREQTKGGLPIAPPPTVQQQPTTGPEMFALITLLPAGLLGWALRKKTSAHT